jgi:hypothetical protein
LFSIISIYFKVCAKTLKPIEVWEKGISPGTCLERKERF